MNRVKVDERKLDTLEELEADIPPSASPSSELRVCLFSESYSVPIRAGINQLRFNTRRVFKRRIAVTLFLMFSETSRDSERNYTNRIRLLDNRLQLLFAYQHCFNPWFLSQWVGGSCGKSDVDRVVSELEIVGNNLAWERCCRIRGSIEARGTA